MAYALAPMTRGYRGLKKDSTRDGAVEARRAHNPKAVGSNPTPATNGFKQEAQLKAVLLVYPLSTPNSIAALCPHLSLLPMFVQW